MGKHVSALAPIAALVVALAILSTAILLARLSARERSAREGIARDRALAEAELERASRLIDLDRALERDPDGRSIDPVREPTLHRIFLLRRGAISPEQFAAESDREALLERVVADLDELSALYERDRTSLLAAWRRRFGREPAPGEIERLTIGDAGKPVA
jgi:hypothetical protein